VGQTLTANTSALGGDGAIQYQWQRDDQNIAGANSSTYALITADEGTTISVVVSREGYAGTKSASVGPIALPGDLWDGSTADDFAGGSGIETDPYLISTGAQLAYLADQVNRTDYSGTYFKLTADLDLNGDTYEWTAIGKISSFTGNFDGADHVIYRLTIDHTVSPGGLFGSLDGAQVKNLGLVALDIKGASYVGGVAGFVDGNSSIENSYSTGAVSGTNRVGGVAGLVQFSSIVENSYSSGAVSGTGYYVGGVAGDVYDSSTVQNSYSSVDVIGTVEVGGVAGYVGYGSSIENSYSSGAVSGTDHAVGGDRKSVV
jgi:hypothetical protein